jgi:hypothetical protein
VTERPQDPPPPARPDAGRLTGHRPWYYRREPLSEHEAARRLSAYIYGNILILAALVPFQEDLDTGRAMAVVIGTALSTFVAHAFSEFISGGGKAQPAVLIRESLPILTTATVPMLLLAISWLGWPSAWVAVLLAELVIVVRIALTGAVAARLNAEKSPLRILLSGVIVAGVALLIVLLKVTLTH